MKVLPVAAKGRLAVAAEPQVFVSPDLRRGIGVVRLHEGEVTERTGDARGSIGHVGRHPARRGSYAPPGSESPVPETAIVSLDLVGLFSSWGRSARRMASVAQPTRPPAPGAGDFGAGASSRRRPSSEAEPLWPRPSLIKQISRQVRGQATIAEVRTSATVYRHPSGCMGCTGHWRDS